MKAASFLAVSMSLVLGGCQAQAPGDRASAPGSPAVSPGAEAPPSPSPSPSAKATPDIAGPATLQGYGDMRLGGTSAEMKQAWGGELDGSATEPDGCHYLTPKWVADSGELAFMVEGERFVRYDVGTTKEAAPGGGKVGMNAQALEALYGVMEVQPHKYVEGGRYLSPPRTPTEAARLVFETDATGLVTSWRVGLPPQVDYVEGCS